MSEEKKKAEREEDAAVNEEIQDMGQVTLEENTVRHRIHLLTIIGEVEGHESAPSHSKTTETAVLKRQYRQQ